MLSLQPVLKGLQQSGLKIVAVSDVTPVRFACNFRAPQLEHSSRTMAADRRSPAASRKPGCSNALSGLEHVS